MNIVGIQMYQLYRDLRTILSASQAFQTDIDNENVY